MSYHAQRIEKLTEQYKAMLDELVDVKQGLPRPVIGLDDTMPFHLPVRQRVLKQIEKLAHDTDNEFDLPELEFVVHRYEEEQDQRVVILKPPYEQLSRGDVVDHDESGKPVVLAEVTVTDVPDNWRSTKTLDLYIRARAKHKRYGEALAVSERINLRTPRWAITGKETGI